MTARRFPPPWSVEDNGIMKKTHRNVEFDVHRLDDGRWEWIAYPKLGEGERFAGALEADEEKATGAAMAAIDVMLGPQSDPSQWSGTSNWDPSVARQQNTRLLEVAFKHSRRHHRQPCADQPGQFPRVGTKIFAAYSLIDENYFLYTREI